jgi:hypothetical protein
MRSEHHKDQKVRQAAVLCRSAHSATSCM